MACADGMIAISTGLFLSHINESKQMAKADSYNRNSAV